MINKLIGFVRRLFGDRGILKLEEVYSIAARKGNVINKDILTSPNGKKVKRTNIILCEGHKYDYIEQEVLFFYERICMVRGIKYFPRKKVIATMWVYGILKSVETEPHNLQSGDVVERLTERDLDKSVVGLMQMQEFKHVLVIREGSTIRLYEPIHNGRDLPPPPKDK